MCLGGKVSSIDLGGSGRSDVGDYLVSGPFLSSTALCFSAARPEQVYSVTFFRHDLYDLEPAMD